MGQVGKSKDEQRKREAPSFHVLPASLTRPTRPTRLTPRARPAPARLARPPVCAALPAGLQHEADVADHHPLVHRLDHVVDRSARRRRRRSALPSRRRSARSCARALRCRSRAPSASDRRARSTSGSGWQSGMSAEVCLAAMMPASRAACSGSPFLTRAAADQRQRLARHADRAARDRLALGHRLVADVDHLHAPARVDVGRARGLTPLHCSSPRPAPERTTGSRATRSGPRSSASRPAAPAACRAKNSAPP